MNNRYVFFTSLWLFLGYPMAMLANASAQQYVSKYPAREPIQPSLLAAKPAAGIPTETTKKKLKVLIQPPTAEQKDAQNRRLIAEEMTMQRAWMYSAVLPGLGQAYNEHYWRIPVIYAVLAGLTWGAVYNHNVYIETKHKLLAQKEYSSYTLRNYVDNCRRDRDLCVIFAALWYIANIFDAYVGASLKTFDLSDDIGLKVQPSVAPPTTQHSPTVGLSLTISLKQ